ncbi:MAG: response regulator transcription factor [Syntrophales bacterium]|nr:response regulator transcription factor [Syntrophales bacterium]
MKKIEMVLVDDHRLFREGVRNLLEQQADMTVVGEAEDGRTATDLVQTLSPTLVVMDVTMPDLNGINATRQILSAKPDIKVLALSMHAHRPLVREMLEAGASGYLLKECAFDELVQAIHSVVEKNQVYLSPKISQMVLEDYLRPPRKSEMSGILTLTPSEREIAQLITEGKTSRQIAGSMGISVRTVEKHRLDIMRKLKIRTVAELVKYAIREGLTSP